MKKNLWLIVSQLCECKRNVQEKQPSFLLYPYMSTLLTWIWQQILFFTYTFRYNWKRCLFVLYVYFYLCIYLWNYILCFKIEIIILIFSKQKTLSYLWPITKPYLFYVFDMKVPRKDIFLRIIIKKRKKHNKLSYNHW